MKARVERYVEQISDGNHYKGHVKIAGTTLTYELKFTVPIPRLDDMEPIKSVEEARRIIQFAVKNGEATVDLSDDEYGFFLHLLLEFAVNFYNQDQTRGSNQGKMGQLVRGESPLSRLLDASVSIGMSDSGTYDFEPGLCEMLNTRFGCTLAAQA